MTIGIAHNPYSTNVPSRLAKTATDLGIPIRVIDLPTLMVDVKSSGEAIARDAAGVVHVASLAPYLFSGYPTAVHAFRALTRRAYVQKPADSVLIADDKAATAIRLTHSPVPQVPSIICPLDLRHALTAAERTRYPVVIKHTRGANGRWVRRAEDAASLAREFHELEAKGQGSLILQPQITECYGRSIRAVVTGKNLLVATLRVAVGNEWRSNIAYGATQHPIDLTSTEKRLTEEAARTIGLGHAGIDILRTERGPLVLEVNSYPDFTSMIPHFQEDLAQTVLLACLPP